MAAHFTPALFEFLRELARNNRRDWFERHKPRYEEVVKEPALRFISDFGPELKTVSGQFLAIPKAVGGSLFRIYRDVRFSKDKRPYKTHVGLHFRHRAYRDAHAPGFYLHLEPGEVFTGVGLWHPDSATLRRIRDRLVEDPGAWRAAADDTGFRGRFELAGESLKRPPRGYPSDHPLIEDLKRKDFVAVERWEEADAVSPGFLGRFAASCRAGSPLVRFLCEAIGVDF